MKKLLLSTKYGFLFFFFLALTSFHVRSGGTGIHVIHESDHKKSSNSFETYLKQTYDSCSLKEKGLSYDVFEKAIVGYYNIKQSESSRVQKNIVTIVDFQKRSKEKRLWVIDLSTVKVLFHTLVAHGKNTGEDLAVNFSNTPESNMSSLGFYCTGETYCGKHGLSLRLNGLDQGFNTNARDRAIVMHGADYVCEEFIDCYGRLGRSQGCPAVPVKEHKEIIETIAGGSVLFIHHSSPHYQSVYLNKEKASQEFLKNRG